MIAVVVPDDGEARGIAIGHAAEQDSVDDAENRGVRADAEREGEYGDGCECRALSQHPRAKNQVLPERSHKTPPRDIAPGLRGMFVASRMAMEMADWLWVSLIRVSEG